MRRLSSVLFGLITAVAPLTARAQGAARTVARSATTLTAAPARGTSRGARARNAPAVRQPTYSVGYTNAGRLQNAARLTEDETVRYVPGRVLHYGTDELVGLVRRAARAVWRRHHLRLAVGDLSASRGGPVGHHASHQSGRDADLGFFVLDRRGRHATLDDYVGFRGDGRAMVGTWRFDTARNWALVEALVNDPLVHVEHVFVSNGLRALLLAHGRAVGATGGTLARASEVMHQPTTGSPHANHFHVRIACPRGDAACLEGSYAPPPPPPRRGRARGRPQGTAARRPAPRAAH